MAAHAAKIAAGGSGLGLLVIALLLLGGGGRRTSPLRQRLTRPAKVPRGVDPMTRPAQPEKMANGHATAATSDPEYLAARRAELTAQDLGDLWRMVQSENEDASDEMKTEMGWAVINRAHQHHVSVHQLLMPDGKPSHQVGSRPPFSTWKPTGKDGQPTETPEGAAQEAEQWVGRDPQLQGAIEWFQPALQDKLVAAGAKARAKREKGEALSPKEQRVALIHKTAEQFRADRPGKSLGMVGPLEFFRA